MPRQFLDMTQGQSRVGCRGKSAPSKRMRARPLDPEFVARRSQRMVTPMAPMTPSPWCRENVVGLLWLATKPFRPSDLPIRKLLREARIQRIASRFYLLLRYRFRDDDVRLRNVAPIQLECFTHSTRRAPASRQRGARDRT